MAGAPAVMTTERLEERGRALAELLAAGVSPGRLVRLDAQVREARRTDWPERPAGPEPR